MSSKIITESEDLYISLEVIGYEEMGESILFSIYSKLPNPRLHFIAVIDCYKKLGENLTYRLIGEKFRNYPRNRKKLDFVCWTHPDNDHTLGLDEILSSYTDTKTIISLPVPVMFLPTNNESKKVVNFLQGRSKGKRVYNRQNYSPFTEVNYLIPERTIVMRNNTRISFFVKNIGPFLNVYSNNVGKYNPNDLSPIIHIGINGMNLVLGGDGTNMTIEEGINDIPANTSFVKIPHHCSDTSDKLLDCFGSSNSNLISCTTKFRSKLPEYDVLKNYYHISKSTASTSKSIPSAKRYSFKSSTREIKDTKLKKISMVSYIMKIAFSEVVLIKRTIQ